MGQGIVWDGLWRIDELLKGYIMSNVQKVVSRKRWTDQVNDCLKKEAWMLDEGCRCHQIPG